VYVEVMYLVRYTSIKTVVANSLGPTGGCIEKYKGNQRLTDRRLGLQAVCTFLIR
jgi:hypothetical protein